MNKFLMGCGIFLAIIVFIALSIGGWVVGKYNGLITLRVDTQTQQGQIETQLQRRFDLVPNLVSSVKGAMAQEQAVFKAIADARTKYAGVPAGSSDKLAAGQQYESAIARLLVVMENYPELKSIPVVQDLMTQLEGSENRISVARQRYNESSQTYNRTLQSFPTNIIGGMFGFRDAVFFKGVEGSQVAPTVDFTK
jgi:LemA protein